MHNVFWIGFCEDNMIFGVDNFTSLLHDSEVPVASRGFYIPDELLFISLLKYGNMIRNNDEFMQLTFLTASMAFYLSSAVR